MKPPRSRVQLSVLNDDFAADRNALKQINDVVMAELSANVRDRIEN